MKTKEKIMPCQGASASSDTRVEEVFNEVMNFLHDQKHIDRNKSIPVTTIASYRHGVDDQLKDAIREILFQQDCEDF